MGDAQAIDYLVGILNDPFNGIHMGITAENVAERYGITREMQDELAWRATSGRRERRRRPLQVADRPCEDQDAQRHGGVRC